MFCGKPTSVFLLSPAQQTRSVRGGIASLAKFGVVGKQQYIQWAPKKTGVLLDFCAPRPCAADLAGAGVGTGSRARDAEWPLLFAFTARYLSFSLRNAALPIGDSAA